MAEHDFWGGVGASMGVRQKTVPEIIAAVTKGVAAGTAAQAQLEGMTRRSVAAAGASYDEPSLAGSVASMEEPWAGMGEGAPVAGLPEPEAEAPDAAGPEPEFC